MLRSVLILAVILCGTTISADDAPPHLQPTDLVQPRPIPGLIKRRAELRSYLQKQSGVRREKPTIPRGKPADFLYCFREYDACKGDKRKLYGVVASQLRLVEALIEQEDIEVRRSGLAIIWQASYCALQDIQDPKLAVEICDIWMQPNLHLASPHDWQFSGLENMLTCCVAVYSKAEAHEQLLATSKFWLDKNIQQRDLNTADTARLKMAVALEGLKRYDEAIHVLEEITHPSLATQKSRIPGLRSLRDAQPMEAAKQEIPK